MNPRTSKSISASRIAAPHRWLMGWRDATTAITERTVVSTVMPIVGVGHTYPPLFPMSGGPRAAACLLANLNCFPLDYVARQKLGGIHLTYNILNQLPVLSPASYAVQACNGTIKKKRSEHQASNRDGPIATNGQRVVFHLSLE